MEEENKSEKKHTWMLFILPIISILIGIGFCIVPIKLLFTGEKIVGTVVDVRTEQSKDDDGNVQTLYSPVIKYTCGGKELIESPGYFSSKHYAKDQTITILCNGAHPTEFTTYGSFIPLIFTLFGIIFLFIQIYNLKAAEKQKIREELRNREELDDADEFKNIEVPQQKFQKNILQKNLSEIEFFQKLPSVKINNELGTAIIALICSIGLGYLIYVFIFGDGEREIGGAIFIGIFELVFLCLFITKLGEYIENTIAKRKIKRGNMTIIQARVTGFQHTADALDNSYYQIICSDGISRFKSEETAGKIYGFNDIPLNYLESLKIIYDPENPQKTLQELDAHPKRFRIPDQYEDTASRLAKQIAGGENYKHSYGIFNKKKISVGDTINVYIDPNNKKSYLVDLSFLK